ncbi:MAG TPA: hypothetical protein VMS21_08255 [Methylomirabilota bacterium]|nr:hypothetical protein [Methylomirabilota bacterium]
MKRTPRHLLLARHRNMSDRLDRVRASALSESLPHRTPSESRTSAPVTIRIALAVWWELIQPARRAWTGMACVWLVILVVNMALRESPPDSAHAGPLTPEAIQVLKEQERMMAELIGEDRRPRVEAVEPTRPEPRGELRRKEWRV